MDIAIVKTQPSGFFARENSTITPHATSSVSSAPPAGSPAVAAAPAAAEKDPQIDGCKGWITVLGSFIIHIWAIGMTYAFGVFIKPLQAEFGVRREPIVWLNGLCSFMLLASGIGTGYLADRWSYRGVALVGTFLIVLGMELSSIVTELWQMFFTYGIIQGIGGGFCFIPAVSVISEWFQIRRGLATGLAVSGSGIGTLILPLIAQPIINSKGWRWTMRIFGFIALACLLAGSMCIIRRTNVKRKRKFVGKAVVLTRTFLFLGPAIFFYSLGFLIPITNCVANAQDKDIDNPQALLAVIGASSTVGRIILGFVADKLGKVNVLKGSMLVMTVATPFWPFIARFWQYLIFCIVFGFAAGSFIALVAPTAGDYFGVTSIAGIAGIIYALCAVGNLLGPPMSARMFDMYGNYIAAAIFSAACTGVGFLCLWGLEPAPKALAKFREGERRREEARAERRQAGAAATELALRPADGPRSDVPGAASGAALCCVM